jgi:hypothetical protein
MLEELLCQLCDINEIEDDLFVKCIKKCVLNISNVTILVTNVTKVGNEMKISQIIVTNVTGCNKCYSTRLKNGQKTKLIRLYRCYKVVTALLQHCYKCYES